MGYSKQILNYETKTFNIYENFYIAEGHSVGMYGDLPPPVTPSWLEA